MRVEAERIALSPLDKPRASHTGVVLDGERVLLVGGNGRTRGEGGGDCADVCHSLADVTIVDLARGTTSPGPPLRQPREGALVARTAEGVIAAGGHADYG